MNLTYRVLCNLHLKSPKILIRIAVRDKRNSKIITQSLYNINKEDIVVKTEAVGKWWSIYYLPNWIKFRFILHGSCCESLLLVSDQEIDHLSPFRGTEH